MDDYSTDGYGDIIFLFLIILYLLLITFGIIQLLGALIRTVICLNTKQPLGKLKTYWLMVGVYFLVFAILYISQHLILNVTTYEALSNTYGNYDKFQWSRYLMVTQVVWFFLAWIIIIWYSIKIVFVKRKNTTQINKSTIHQL